MKIRILLATALLLCRADLRAQTPEPADTLAVRSALVRQGICPGGAVRVVAEGERLQGRCDGVLDERLLVWTAAESRRVPLAAVDSLWVRRSGFDRGVRNGAIFGGVAGGLFGGMAISSYCGGASRCGGGVILGSLGFAAVGSLAGILIGGAVGESARSWVRLHPR